MTEMTITEEMVRGEQKKFGWGSCRRQQNPMPDERSTGAKKLEGGVGFFPPKRGFPEKAGVPAGLGLRRLRSIKAGGGAGVPAPSSQPPHMDQGQGEPARSPHQQSPHVTPQLIVTVHQLTDAHSHNRHYGKSDRCSPHVAQQSKIGQHGARRLMLARHPARHRILVGIDAAGEIGSREPNRAHQKPEITSLVIPGRAILTHSVIPRHRQAPEAPRIPRPQPRSPRPR